MRAALFLDFDSFFSGLMSADPASALALVTSPSQWIQRLTTSYSDGGARRWLVLRCYMNPAGSLPDPHKPGERLYFSKFRPFFTQAGVEVVDCPALTKGSKNGADIRIVIDVMTALRANTRYEEFVIASADADFTPLLQVVRADDRRVTVIATSSTATAYEALADRFLDEQDVFELIAKDASEDAETEDAASTLQLEGIHSSVLLLDGNPNVDTSYQAFATAVRRTYFEATTPINLARLSSDARTAAGVGVSDGTWFGAGSFIRAVQRLELPNVRFSQHYLWDATRHTEPAAKAVTVKPSLPAAVLHFAETTGMPTIASNEWPAVYRKLEAYAAMHVFNFTEASKWARDQASQEGFDIPRSAFTFVIRACQDGEANLNADPSPDAGTIARSTFNSVLRRAEQAGLEIGESEKQELAAWIHYQDSEHQG
ncbi:NYN domain-containing protein [Arthrobacter sp. NQ4]|uniref:NYN domain-containing protein n=1 Tax=Arthrobacter sp. NQ4 TaxID=3027930 RepID=UPI0023B0844D|nr:NYN domain-containing protein [Arthrobacter sp. NQ4]MDE8588362.1 NYN domain-containing protein [Arthrobacter sp. NQ4]